MVPNGTWGEILGSLGDNSMCFPGVGKRLAGRLISDGSWFDSSHLD